VKHKKEAYFDAEWINQLETRNQWNLYWMQQHIMQPYIKKDHNLVELGVGSGFTSNYLKSRGFSIKTIDIDPAKNPDIVCDATNWNPSEYYNGFLAFQVFEHMPFEIFEKTIKNLSNLKVEYLYISVPHNFMSKKSLVRGNIYLAKLGKFDLELRWPPFGSKKIKTRSHFWELNDKSISMDRYLNVYKDAGYKRILDERVSYAHFNVFKLED